MPNENASGVRRMEADVASAAELPEPDRVGFVVMGLSFGDRAWSRTLRQASVVACGGVFALSGCAQPPQKHLASHGKEYFPSAIYGAASARVVEDGQPVPKGGGQYLVGHPYTVAGKRYYPAENPGYAATGYASWYGDAFHGRRTANGEVYDMRSLTAAHPTMPLPSYARVTNLTNGYSVIVRVNDRGPYHGGRIMDVSSRVADVLDFKRSGTGHVKVEYIGRAPMEGSDDDTLLASLRTDGSPASMEGGAGATMVAAVTAPAAPLISLFSSSHSSSASAPTPPPAPPRVAEPEVQTADNSDEAETTVKPRVLAHVPTPPERPFDLGQAKRDPLMQLASAPLPPHRAQGDRALYFATYERPDAGPIASALKHAKTRPLADSDD